MLRGNELWHDTAGLAKLPESFCELNADSESSASREDHNGGLRSGTITLPAASSDFQRIPAVARCSMDSLRHDAAFREGS